MIKTFSFLSLFCLASFGFSQIEANSDELPEKEYQKKIDELNASIELDSTNSELYIKRGYQYQQQKLIDEAFKNFSKAIELDPKSPIGYHYRATLFYSIGYAEDAILDNTQAIQLTKNDSLKTALLNNRGNAKTMKRDFQGAYEDYFKVLQFDSTDFAALTNISTSLNYLDRNDEAIEYLETVIRLYPNSYGGYVNLAYTYMKNENYDKALEMNNKALSIDSLQPNAYNNRGFVKYKLGDFKGALLDVNKSLKLYPDNSFAYKNRSLIFLAQEKVELACKDVERALELGFTSMYGNELQQIQDKHCK